MFPVLYILLAAGAVLRPVCAAPSNNHNGHYHGHGHSSSRASTRLPASSTTLIAVPSSIVEIATSSVDIPIATPQPDPTQGGSSPSSIDTPEPSSTISSTTPTAPVAGAFWKPAAGAKWQIELANAVTDTSFDADIFDMDLFDNPATTITTLHGLNRKVICYFSAGTSEDWRPDAASFQAADKGAAMEDWPGEFWLNTKSANVRAIMTSRIELAVSKGCDGIDPDNVDGYNNENGLGLTSADAIDYLTFLSETAHAHGLSIGLKNAGEIVPDVLSIMEWEVNEQCAEFGECDTFAPFTTAGKPVFHIEYVGESSGLTTQSAQACPGAPSGFSSVLKKLALDAWIQTC